jgi:hypothetical protein
VLPNVNDLTHVDFARKLYSSQVGIDDEVSFKDSGHVYGPIRLSADPSSQVYRKLIAPSSSPDFIKNKLAIGMIRDPRDILVSLYYSAGFTHPFSSVAEIRKKQQARRRQIQKLSLDEFALLYAGNQVVSFEKMLTLKNDCDNFVLIKYEDMIERFDYFFEQLNVFFSFSDEIADMIHERSRPKEKEDTTVHRRSGKVGGFRTKLKEETISLLNVELKDTLDAFNYAL